MSSAQIEIQLIASVVAAACAIPGVFLILRRMALMSDAISHAILLGIVVAFFIVKDLASPILMVAAALTGILTVALVEVISKTKLVKEDAALGLVFPVLFSIGVILISRYAGNVHLDADSVLLGELAFAPFNRLEISGIDIGPKSLYVMGGILVINIVFITVFFKELKLATFDAGLATILGFMPVTLHYALMGLISLTAVGAFDAVGSILVVALMIAPPATAYLLTDSLARMLIYSGLLAIVSAIGGYWLAHGLDASIAGSMATMTGIVFLLVFLFTPSRGLIAIARRRHEQKFEFAMTSLLIHLAQHEKEPDAAWECNEAHLEAHFRWESEFADRIIRKAEKEGFITKIEDLLALTTEGRSDAQKAIVR